MAVLSLKKGEKFLSFSIVCTQINKVANFLSPYPFFCVILGAMYFNFTLIHSCLHSHEKASFSPPLLQWMYLTKTPYITFTSCNMHIITSFNSNFLLKYTPGIICIVFYYEKLVFLTTYTGSRWRANIDEQPLIFICWMWNSHFVYPSFFSLSLSNRFARFEFANQLKTHCFSSGLSDPPKETLAQYWYLSWLALWTVFPFVKEFYSDNQSISNFNLVIWHYIVICSFKNNIIFSTLDNFLLPQVHGWSKKFISAFA